MARLSSLVYCLWARPGAYHRKEPLKSSLIGQAPALPTNIRQGWKGLPGTNTSLLQKSVNYGCKKFMTLGSDRKLPLLEKKYF
jgi:hypothetical protein